MKEKNEEPIVLEGVEVDVSNFGFKKVEDTDEIKFDNQRDYIVSLLHGTIDLYDSMINDPRLSSEARKKLEEMKAEKVNIIKNELTNQLMSDFDELMDSLSNPDILIQDKENALKEVTNIVSICRDDLKDDKLAVEFENRVSTLQDAYVSLENKSEKEEKDSLCDFESMTNNELYKYLFDLEEKIKAAAKKSNNDEVHKLLDECVRLQEEIDKRINGITAKKEEPKHKSKKESSLEDELDDFDKERDKIIKAEHFSKESRDEMLDNLYEEREAKKGGRKR